MGGTSRSVDDATDFTFVQTPGQTPYSKTRLKVYAQPVLPFGELIFGQKAKVRICRTSQPQFVCGCWLDRESWCVSHGSGSKIDRGHVWVG